MGDRQNKGKRKFSFSEASPNLATSLEREFDMEEAKSKCNKKDDKDRSEENGKPVDPRLIALLDFVDELSTQNRELFSKIFPKMHDQHVETIKKFKVKNSIKFDDVRKIPKLEKEKAIGKLKDGRMMTKSSSIGSPRELPRDIGGGEQLKVERFKVKTVEEEEDKEGGEEEEEERASGAWKVEPGGPLEWMIRRRRAALRQISLDDVCLGRMGPYLAVNESSKNERFKVRTVEIGLESGDGGKKTTKGGGK